MWPCRQFYLHYILALKHISQQVRNQVPGNLAVRVCKILKISHEPMSMHLLW